MPEGGDGSRRDPQLVISLLQLALQAVMLSHPTGDQSTHFTRRPEKNLDVDRPDDNVWRARLAGLVPTGDHYQAPLGH